MRLLRSVLFALDDNDVPSVSIVWVSLVGGPVRADRRPPAGEVASSLCRSHCSKAGSLRYRADDRGAADGCILTDVLAIEGKSDTERGRGGRERGREVEYGQGRGEGRFGK